MAGNPVGERAVLRKPKAPNLDKFGGSAECVKEVRDSVRGTLEKPSNAWQHFYLLLHDVLKQGAKSGLTLPERWHYAELMRQLYRNGSFVWSNAHRGMPLWYGYGSCVVFLLPSEVREMGDRYRQPGVVRFFEEKLQALVDGCLMGLGARKGSCIRLHPTVFDPDERKIPYHYHCWLMPYKFDFREARMFYRFPDAALAECMEKGEKSLRERPGAEGPVTRWLSSRRFTPEDWNTLITKLEKGWRGILKEIFPLVGRMAHGRHLVQTETAIRNSFYHVVPKYRSSYIRKPLDLARVISYMRNGSSIRSRVSIGLSGKPGKVKVKAVFGRGKAKKEAEYEALAFLRRFLPRKPSVRDVGSTGMFFNNGGEDNSLMRVFEAILSERFDRRGNELLFWATLPASVIRKRLDPISAGRLLAKAGKVLAVLNDLKARAAKKETPERKLWERYNRFFSGQYRVVLGFLMYLADEAKRRKRKAAGEEMPHQFLRRHPLSKIKAHADSAKNVGFRASPYCDPKTIRESKRR